MKIDHESSVSLYEQVRAQIIEQIESGALIVGAKLPTVRKLATDLGVAPYTVARVYRVMENDGFLETRGRNGTLVKGNAGTAPEALQQLASAYATRAAELGIPAADALSFIHAALEAADRTPR